MKHPNAINEIPITNVNNMISIGDSIPACTIPSVPEKTALKINKIPEKEKILPQIFDEYFGGFKEIIYFSFFLYFSLPLVEIKLAMVF